LVASPFVCLDVRLFVEDLVMAEQKREKRDLRMEVANRLVEQIEQGTAFFQRPWVAGEVLTPINAITGKGYRGINAEYLMYFSPDNSDPRWCTYKQAQEQGWQVRKGASGVPIEVWKQYEHTRTTEEIEKLKAAGAKNIEPTEQRLGVRHYTVFHASQIDGIPQLERTEYLHQLEGKPDPRLDGLAEAMGVSVKHGGSKAFYRLSEDRIQLPPIESFLTASGHDTTFLHEMAHATGHESRMQRDMEHAFGSEEYAIEELRAEMSAAMTAASLGIGFDPESQNIEEGRELSNSAAYLATWLRQLSEKERKQVLMNAIRDAQDISDYLMDRAPELQEKQKMEEGVQRMRNPQIGDLVRFEPHEPGVNAMPFSGRIIAALDTSGGDIRYHLRAESGPDKDIEGRFYGRDGKFRAISLDQAVGFDRALTPDRSSEVHVGDFVMTRGQQFGMDWDTRSIVTGINDSEVRLQDLYRSGQEWEATPVGRTMARQDFDAALQQQVSGVVPADIAAANLNSATSRERFIGAVRSFDAGASLVYGKTPEPITRVPADLAPFLGSRQALATNHALRGEDRGFFMDKMQELQEIVRQMPSTYETDGLPDAARPVYLRYFGHGNSQWFILEKDRGDSDNAPGVVPRQTQVFGLADLGMGKPELGYISIPEITRAGAELDYHFTPTNLLEIKRQHYPEMLPPEQRLGVEAVQVDPPLDEQTVEDTDEFSMPNMAAMAAMLDEEDSEGEGDSLAADYF
jgi:antirestriction protein ArdC